MAQYRRILCASDLTGASRRAFATAIATAKTNNARLIVLHVLEPIMPVIPAQYITSTAWEQVDTGTRAWAGRQLALLAGKARKEGIRVTTLLRQGFAADEIVRVARSQRVDLLVVGTHSRRGFSKLILGSVAERVAATAPCPVVTVRGK